MKTITFNSTKGGCGKSTLSILTINTLVKAGYKVLAIDMDTINHSLSYYFSGSGQSYQDKNIFNVFAGQNINENIVPLGSGLSLIPSCVQLSDFRTVEYGRLKRCLKAIPEEEKPDYLIIDTSPTFDNITINAFTVSDFLIIPAIPEPFNYQAIRYLIPKVGELELSNLDVNVVLNQYNRPRSENQETFSNQVVSLFTEDEILGKFVSPHKISFSNHFKKYSSSREFRFNSQYGRQRGEALCLVNGLLGLSIDVEEI